MPSSENTTNERINFVDTRDIESISGDDIKNLVNDINEELDSAQETNK